MDACEVPAGWMINNKLFMITGGNLAHIMHFLNSKLFNRIIFQTANFGGGKGVDRLQEIRMPLPVECNLAAAENADVKLAQYYNLTDEEKDFIGIR